MPTVSITTSATDKVDFSAATKAIATASGAPAEHVHISWAGAQTMTFGGKLGSAGAHVAQVSVTTGKKLGNDAKAAVVSGLMPLLAGCGVSGAATQVVFAVAQEQDIFINGAAIGGGGGGKKDGGKKEKDGGKKDGGKKDGGKDPKQDEAAIAAKQREKLLAKVFKEGGKKGVEIEGASDMGGLDFFCTTIETPDGDVELLNLAMKGMNAAPDPANEEERKGCSGHVGKMIFSAGATQLAMVAYVPDGDVGKTAAGKVTVKPWMEAVCKAVDGKLVGEPTKAESPNGGLTISAVVLSDPDKDKFALKDKDAAMKAAFDYLREKGAFPEDTGDDDDDECCYGDDAFDDIDNL